jgi:hypothetical protein
MPVRNAARLARPLDRGTYFARKCSPINADRIERSFSLICAALSGPFPEMTEVKGPR